MSKEAKKAAAASGAAPVEAQQPVSLLDQIVEEGRLARDPEAKGRGKDMVAEFVASSWKGTWGFPAIPRR